MDWNSRHPEILNYFSEIVSAYERLCIHRFAQSSGEWGVSEYFLYSDSQRRHIAVLSDSLPADQRLSCFWGFNRGISKISKIHQTVSSLNPDHNTTSLLIHRDPSQQFGSILYQSMNGNHWFEARPYHLWLAGVLVSGLAPERFITSMDFRTLTEDEIVRVLSLLPERKELSSYLYSCVIVKALMLSIKGWPMELQEGFLRNNCFLVDAFTCRDERSKFASHIEQYNICLDLDDFRLESQKAIVSADQFATTLSCAFKSIAREMPIGSSLLAVSDYFRRLADADASYSSLLVDRLPFAPLRNEEIEFMDLVKSQAEDFVLLADNRRLNEEIAALRGANQRLCQDEKHLCIKISALEEQNARLVNELNNRSDPAREDRQACVGNVNLASRGGDELQMVRGEQDQRIGELEKNLETASRDCLCLQGRLEETFRKISDLRATTEAMARQHGPALSRLQGNANRDLIFDKLQRIVGPLALKSDF